MRKNGTLALPSTMGVSIQAFHRSLGWERIGPGTNNDFNMDHSLDWPDRFEGPVAPLPI